MTKRHLLEDDDNVLAGLEEGAVLWQHSPQRNVCPVVHRLRQPSGEDACLQLCTL